MSEVLEIVKAFLETNGYDGLVEEYGECACEIADLAPCGQLGHNCSAGYRTTEVPEGCEGGADFYIVPGNLKAKG